MIHISWIIRRFETKNCNFPKHLRTIYTYIQQHPGARIFSVPAVIQGACYCSRETCQSLAMQGIWIEPSRERAKILSRGDGDM